MPDTAAIEALQNTARDEWSVMVSFIRYRTRAGRHDAEDWLQEAILRVLQQIQSGAPFGPIGNWRAYLAACAVHEGYGAGKLKRLRREVSLDEVVLGSPSPLDRVKLRSAA